MKIDRGSAFQRMKKDLESLGELVKTTKETSEKVTAKLNEEKDEVATGAGEIQRKTEPVVSEINKNLGPIKKVADGVEDRTRVVYTFVRSKLDKALERGAEFVMAEGSTGNEIGVDSHIRPRDFEYGKHKKTIADFNIGLREEKTTPNFDLKNKEISKTEDLRWAGMHGRLFGHHDKRNLNASIGAEGEAGAGLSSITTGKQDYGKFVAFVGMQARVFAEAGPFGASIGAEGFAGYRHYLQIEASQFKGHKFTFAQQVEIGMKAVAHAHLGPLGFDSSGQIRAGFRARLEMAQFFPIPGTDGNWQIFGRGNFDGFAGAMLTGAASLGISPSFIGAQAGAEAFVGLRERLQATTGIGYQGQEILGGFGYAEGWAGFGARANARAGYDVKTGELGVSGEVGAGFIVGGALGFGITTPVGEFGNNISRSVGYKSNKESNKKQVGPNFEKKIKDIF